MLRTYGSLHISLHALYIHALYMWLCTSCSVPNRIVSYAFRASGLQAVCLHKHSASEGALQRQTRALQCETGALQRQTRVLECQTGCLL